MADGQGQQGGSDAMVPSGRLREETTKRETAEARVAELEGRVRELEGGQASWKNERDVYRAGITDPEGVEVALFLYEKLPAKDRPKNAGDWVRSQTAETAHRALAGYLPKAGGVAQAAAANAAGGDAGASSAQASGTSAASSGTGQGTSTAAASSATAAATGTGQGTTSTSTQTQTQTTTTQATQATNGTTAGAGSRSSGYNAAQIRALREEAQKTGDWSKVRAAMPDIMRDVQQR